MKLAKERHGLDLSAIDLTQPLNSEAFKLLSDPIYLLECFWKLHEDQLRGLGFDEDSFSDAVDEEKVEEVREKTIAACAAFFPFLKTFSTMMRAALPGNPESLVSLEKIQAEILAKRATTPTQ